MATPYKVIVTTGTVPDAGTDADVWVTIYGTNGNSGERLLDNAEDNFENGKVDEFAIDARDLGTLTRLHVRHDNSGNKPGWFLDKIVVVNQLTNEDTTFPCGQWLARDEGDGRIDRILLAVGGSAPQPV